MDAMKEIVWNFFTEKRVFGYETHQVFNDIMDMLIKNYDIIDCSYESCYKLYNLINNLDSHIHRVIEKHKISQHQNGKFISIYKDYYRNKEILADLDTIGKQYQKCEISYDAMVERYKNIAIKQLIRETGEVYKLETFLNEKYNNWSEYNPPIEYINYYKKTDKLTEKLRRMNFDYFKGQRPFDVYNSIKEIFRPYFKKLDLKFK